jgi:chorismate mutase
MGLRTGLIREIEEIKTDLGFPLNDPERDAAVVRRAEGLAEDQGGTELSLVRDIMWRIVANGSGRAASENGGAAEQPLEETRQSGG